MKFYKAKKVETINASRIVWSKEYAGYIFSDLGKYQGKVLCTPEELRQIETDDFSCLKELNIPDEKLSVGFSVEDNHTNMTDLWGSVYLNESENNLPYGAFEIQLNERIGYFFKPYKNALDNPNLIPNKNLPQQVKDFFENGQTGRKNKLGMLLYGNPGNGKTSEAMQLFALCDELKMRIFIVDTDVKVNFLNKIRPLLETERTIFIFEEITERLSKRGVEEILTFLDGENSWNNSITIATTNYPEDLPANLVDRPGRFSTFIKYENPTKQNIIDLGKKFDYTEEESVVLAGKDLSFDYVSFIMSQSRKLNKTLLETVQFEEEKRRRLSLTFKGSMGI
jgi:hypothetical protein